MHRLESDSIDKRATVAKASHPPPGNFLLSGLLAAIVTVSVTVQSARAVGQVSTRQTGVVVSVDVAKRSFVFRANGSSQPVVIEWRSKSEFFGGSKTEFFIGERPADATILQRGVGVFVRYREALFVANRAILVRKLEPAQKRSL